ncbi:uncharacterized protein VTP21DRAFT_3230 [Calcarisporiella thermophila]|uniref:uncharacterized protein n=1 Tax=Calcarisporiella thermophila TaxID=911321 RepID=UPI0037428E8D
MEIWKRASNKLGFTTQQCKNKYDSLLKLWVAVEKKEGMTGSDVQVFEHRDHFERYHGSRENVSPSYKIPGPEYSTSVISVDDQNLGRIISESVEREENNISTVDNEVGPSQESHFEDAEDVSDVEWATSQNCYIGVFVRVYTVRGQPPFCVCRDAFSVFTNGPHHQDATPNTHVKQRLC